MADGRRHKLTLAFRDPALEAEYSAATHAQRLRTMRLGLVSSIAAWLVVAIVWWNVGVGARWVSLGGIAPALALGLGLTYVVHDDRVQQLVSAGLNACGGVAALLLVELTGMQERYEAPAVLVVMAFGYSLVGTRHIYWFTAISTYVLAFLVLRVLRGGPFVFLMTDFVIVFLVTFAVTFGAYLIEAAQREAFYQRRKSDRLLRNILPESIAARLRDDDSTLADGFASATVLFCDLVGFTPRSAQMTPSETVQLLNALFSEFDDLAERHRLEKIKTIGDAYMVAGGVPSPRADHAPAVVAMGLDMLAVARRHGLDARIGVHTGPLVAGVIGKKKFAYDLWGDTVNTASRMESHGVVGRVHVSAETWAALGDRFAGEPRGEIDVKGKGPMRTWLL